MARDLYEQHESVRARFAAADEVLGFSLSTLCFEGPVEQLAQTNVTQPAVFVHSVAVSELLAAAGLQPVAVAGHSLGEYSALVAAGVFSFAEALTLVGTRGRLMKEAGREWPGTMGAVIGLEDDHVMALCQQVADVGIVVAANFNAPGQVVVSGEPAAVDTGGRVGHPSRRSARRRIGRQWGFSLAADGVGGRGDGVAVTGGILCAAARTGVDQCLGCACGRPRKTAAAPNPSDHWSGSLERDGAPASGHGHQPRF